MKAVKRKRPMRRAILPVPDDVDLDAAADLCRYIGSPEHKSFPSFAGRPRWRQADATKCDPKLTDPDEIAAWIAEAIRAGQTGEWEGAFPRYAWYVVGDKCYEARLSNHMSGDYKGYELLPVERPDGL